MSDPRIPVTLITGFLGAGKSTLLNRLLRDSAFRGAAVLVNEFGAVGIDAALVKGVDETVVTLATGCVCCAMRGEMITALRDLHFRRVKGEVPEFGRLAIETTGVADPGPIVATLLRDPVVAAAYRLDGIVAVVDGEHGDAQLDDHAEARAQAAIADRLLISKTDRAAPEAISALAERLAAINPLADVRPMTMGDAPAAAILGAFDAARPRAAPAASGHRDGILTRDVFLPGGESVDAVARRIALFLALSGGRILRLKAIARCDDGALWAFHGVRHVAYPAVEIEDCPGDMENRAVLISETEPDGLELLTMPASAAV